MAIELFSAPLPKGTGGRKPAELDQELYDALNKALTETPTVETDDGIRPRVVGLETRLFPTLGKASSDGRRYARPLAEALDKTVRVRVVDGPLKKEGNKTVPQFGWVLYVPLPSEKADENGAETAPEDSGK